MRISKLLNKKYLLIIFLCLIAMKSYSEDQPVDIWNIDKEEIKKKTHQIIFLQQMTTIIKLET